MNLILSIIISFVSISIVSLIGGAFLILAMAWLGEDIKMLLPAAIQNLSYGNAVIIVFISKLLFK